MTHSSVYPESFYSLVFWCKEGGMTDQNDQKKKTTAATVLIVQNFGMWVGDGHSTYLTAQNEKVQTDWKDIKLTIDTSGNVSGTGMSHWQDRKIPFTLSGTLRPSTLCLIKHSALSSSVHQVPYSSVHQLTYSFLVPLKFPDELCLSTSQAQSVEFDESTKTKKKNGGKISCFLKLKRLI
jgi:hypothetical protein